MARTSLPPGFRFHPTDVELVKYYLKRKVMGKKHQFEAISELNIYKYSPWDLPDKSCLRSKDLEWYFFCPKERKYASGARMNRATEIGYWKSTGKDRSISYKDQTVGMVKTLVFHIGHAPNGERTNWVMHEYRIEDKVLAEAGVVQDAYMLCKVFQKSGPGPKNGAQYGAPFNEEEWDDDSEICAKSSLSVGLPLPPLPCNGSVFVPGSTCSELLSDPGPSKATPWADEVPPPHPDNDEDIISMLDMFTEDSSLVPYQDDNNKEENFSRVQNNEGLARSDGNDIYKDLRDLDNSAELSAGRLNLSSHQTIGYGLNPMVAGNDVEFLELNDLNYPLFCPADERASEYFFTDSLWEPYNYNNSLGQSFYPVDSSGSVQHDSSLNMSPLLPEKYNGHGGHFDAYQEGNGIGGSANLGFTSTSCNVNFTPCGRPEEGTRHAVQGQNRGEPQRTSYSRLQQLLESIHSHPASTAENIAPANRAERFKETNVVSTYYGSSTHAKAEVTRRFHGSTKEALPVMLGDPSQCWPRMGKEVERCNEFGHFFSLGMTSSLIWVILIVVFTKLGRYLWDLSFLNILLRFSSSIIVWFIYLRCVNEIDVLNYYHWKILF